MANKRLHAYKMIRAEAGHFEGEPSRWRGQEMDKHAYKSSFREKLVEHLLIGELLKHNWLKGDADLEVSRPEVDSAGYDFIAETRGVTRHIQLKASKRGARAQQQNCHISLGRKPAGCVVWVYFDEITLELGPFYFFGSEAGAPLPANDHFKVTKQTRANAQGKKAERPDHRRIPKSKFEEIKTVEELYRRLFIANQAPEVTARKLAETQG